VPQRFPRRVRFDHDAEPRLPGLQAGATLRDAISRALGAQALAGELRRDDADLAFMVGLLHDIGRLALASAFAPAYAEAERWRRDRDCPGADAERAVLDIDHAEVGGLIARQWNFAPAIGEVLMPGQLPTRPGEL